MYSFSDRSIASESSVLPTARSPSPQSRWTPPSASAVPTQGQGRVPTVLPMGRPEGASACSIPQRDRNVSQSLPRILRILVRSHSSPQGTTSRVPNSKPTAFSRGAQVPSAHFPPKLVFHGLSPPRSEGIPAFHQTVTPLNGSREAQPFEIPTARVEFPLEASHHL